MSRRRALGPGPVEGTQADTEVTTAPPSIMHSHQPHQQHASGTPHHANQKSVDFSFKKLLQIKYRLNDPAQQHIPKDQCPTLNITCGHFDFKTGQLHPNITAQSINGQSFLKLMRLEDMEKIARAYDLDHRAPGPGTFAAHGDVNFLNAHMVGSAVSYCLNTADGTRFPGQKSL